MFELRSQLLSGAILLEADVQNVPQLTGVYFYFKLYHIILFNQQRSQDMDNFADHFLLIKIQFFLLISKSGKIMKLLKCLIYSVK